MSRFCTGFFGLVCGQKILFDNNSHKKGKTTKTSRLILLSFLLAQATQGALTITSGPNSDLSVNVAVNISRRWLGSFDAEATEALTGKKMDIIVRHETGLSNLVTNAEIVDEAGVTVAGPVDSYRDAAGIERLPFNDTITHLPPKRSYAVRGKLSTEIPNGTKLSLEANPARDWSRPIGLTTGVFFALEDRTIRLSTLMVRKGSLTVSVPERPSEGFLVYAGQRNIKEGLDGVLDATESGEPTRTLTVPLFLTVSRGAKATDITNVILHKPDGTPLNTGVNIVNPEKEGLLVVTLDGTGLITPEGTKQGFSLTFNLRAGSIGRYQWSVPEDLSKMHVVGLGSAQTIVPTLKGSGKAPYFQVFGTPSGFPARITAMEKVQDGFGMTASLYPVAGYQLEFSSDLVSWQPVYEGDGGATKFFIPLAFLPSPNGFFRFKEVPPRRLRVQTSALTPSLKAVAGGSVGVSVLDLEYSAPYESGSLNMVVLRLKHGNPRSILKVSLVHKASGQKVGESFFMNEFAVIQLESEVIAPYYESMTLSVRLDIGDLAPNGPVNTGEVIVVEHTDTLATGLISGEQYFSLGESVSNGLLINETGQMFRCPDGSTPVLRSGRLECP